MVWRAFSGLSQKAGSPIRSLSCRRSVNLPGMSKRVPQLVETARHIVNPAAEFGVHSQVLACFILKNWANPVAKISKSKFLTIRTEGETMTDLNDRVALITGGGSGIGLAVAKQFLAAGAAVAVCGRDETKLTKAIASMETGDRVLVQKTDVTDPKQVQALVEKVTATFG